MNITTRSTNVYFRFNTYEYVLCSIISAIIFENFSIVVVVVTLCNRSTYSDLKSRRIQFCDPKKSYGSELGIEEATKC